MNRASRCRGEREHAARVNMPAADKQIVKQIVKQIGKQIVKLRVRTLLLMGFFTKQLPYQKASTRFHPSRKGSGPKSGPQSG